jgi:molybdate transport system regulatory protein
MREHVHSRILSVPDTRRCLDPIELQQLERAFREWAEVPKSDGIRRSRIRILIVFLLIRYTGARLSEVLNIDLVTDIDWEGHTVRLQKSGPASAERLVQLPAQLCVDLHRMVDGLRLDPKHGQFLRIDSAHVRRKFYARAEAQGVPRDSGTPEAIRRARAVELMQGNLPLPVVQKILGHSTPNLAASYVQFSEEEIRQVERVYIERESGRKTSARNSFFGKINRMHAGDVQTFVEIVSLGGFRIGAVITNYSRERLRLRNGSLVVAEVKAPLVMLCHSDAGPATSAENLFFGEVCRMITGRVTSEIGVRLGDGTELCAIISSRQRLDFKEGQKVWAMFNGFAVVIHTD